MSGKRLFFAIWPDNQVREEVIAVQGKLSIERANPVQANNIHSTLIFIGQADEPYQRCLQSAAKRIKSERFEIGFNKLGYFKKPKVAWLGIDHCPESLGKLVFLMQQAFLSCGFQPERRVFTPHISLFRKAAGIEPGLMNKPVCWLVKDFYLVESVPSDKGVIYQKLERYPLQ